MINHKLITALLIPMLLIPMAGFGYAHWTDSVTKQIKMHVGCFEVEIKTYKILSPWDDELIERWPSDDELEAMDGTSTIWFSTHIFPGWYAWVGFIIQNQGMFPARVDAPTYEVEDPNNIWTWFIHDEYYYGPWPRNDVPKGIYDHVFVQSKKHLGEPLPPNAVPPPPPGNVPPPIYLEVYNEIAGPTSKDSMVMWIFLKLREDCPITPPFYIKISITVTATLAIP